MRSENHRLRARAISLRRLGKTYGEICKIIGVDIAKSTLSTWCGHIPLSLSQRQRVKCLMRKGASKGRATALVVNKTKRENYIQNVKNRVKHLADVLDDRNVSKIALAMLYLGEGSKKQRGSLMFGNSDPLVISLFLRLLRYCYDTDKSKFRCTLQCRADQNIKKLEKFWSKIANIPLTQFYKARIDPRTIGKPSRDRDYKGVCRIDYFSGDIFMELKQIVEVICGPIV